ncbi:MAG: cytochrome c3 family protein [Desulfosudaceae bacterium]
MGKLRARIIWSLGALLVVGGGWVIALGQDGATSSRPEQAKRPDIVTIDISTLGGPKDEMPPVQFVHGRHSQALDQDCAVCHQTKNGTLDFRFKRREQLAAASAGDFYHEHCLSCHVDKKAAGQETGPRIGQCRLCHKTRNLWEPSTQPAGFDPSLHYRHEDSDAIQPETGDDLTNCRVCHHQYDQQTGQLYYEEGAEEACLYCHQDQPTDSVRSLRQASHDSCVACHQKLKEQNTGTGPVTCAACHGPAEARD